MKAQCITFIVQFKLTIKKSITLTNKFNIDIATLN